MGAARFSLDLAMTVRSYSCCHTGCDALIVFPDTTDKELRESRAQWYCYRGHGQSFVEETDEEKLKKQLETERKKREWAEQATQREREHAKTLERSRNLYKGKLKATKTRIKNGVCPCCKRTFSNLHRHMTTQHPNFGDSE